MSFSVGNSFVVDSSRNIILGRLDDDPGSAAAGTISFNNSLGVVRGWNGTQWISLTQSASIAQVWAWGLNSNGQVGDNTIIGKTSPVSVVGGITNWRQVSAGVSHTAAIRNGQAWAWGYGGFGRLGNNNTIDASSPVSVVGGFTDWTDISAGNRQTAAIRNGQAWAWGANANGQLGTNNLLDASSPVSVVGGFTDWIQICAGNFHTIGLRANGQIWSWGFNLDGQLGDGTTTQKSSPVSVVGGFTDWVQVSSGSNSSHALGLRSNGQIWTWGNNSFGQLGDATTIGKSSPVSVAGGFTDWVQVSGGSFHSVGLRVNGQAWTWGSNFYGELGINVGGGSRNSPVSVVGGFSDWVSVSAGRSIVAALRTNGQAWAWGRNNNGQMGDGTSGTNRSSPVSVVGGFTNWIQISSGAYHAAAVRITA